MSEEHADTVPTWDRVFEAPPEYWGSHANRFAWFMMHALIGAEPVDVGDEAARDHLHWAFRRVTGLDLLDRALGQRGQLSAPDLRGVADVLLDLAMWRDELIPLLMRRAQALGDIRPPNWWAVNDRWRRWRPAEEALQHVPGNYRTIGAAELVAIDAGHHFHQGMHMGWKWGQDLRGVYLDFLCEHRHPGIYAARFYVDGTTDPIDTPGEFRLMVADPVEDARLERAFIDRNKAAYENLRSRGLLPPAGENVGSQDISEFLQTGGGADQPGAVTEPDKKRMAADLIRDISSCVEMAETVNHMHPCAVIVGLQGAPTNPDRQVPEPWAGGLLTARVLYLSSNPSISEAGDHNSGTVPETYPLTSWPPDRTVEFIQHRFDQTRDLPWVVDDRFRRQDGALSAKPVPYWRVARKRTREVLGYEPDPSQDYAMTEVVRCKSKHEQGVPEAARMCAERYLDRTLELCPAQLVVVVGAQARNRMVELFDMPQGFGAKGSARTANVTVMRLGGQTRLVVYLPHFVGMEKGGHSFLERYGQSGLTAFRMVALNELSPGDLDMAALKDGA